MERFEMSFKNKAVRVWFYTVFPAMLLTIVLKLVLPYEFGSYISLGSALITIAYFIWYFIYSKKKQV